MRRLARFCVVLAAVSGALAFAGSALADIVTTNADSGPGSLREALTNAVPGDTITFDLAFGNQEIDLHTALPEVAQSVTIDGTVPGDTNGAQAPRIDGALLGPNGIGLTFHSGMVSTVRGLTITRFAAIGINASGDPVNVVGNFIGTDPSSTTGLGNGIGVASNGAVNIGGSNTADRNVISDNQNGINLGSGSSDADVQGNYIGTNVAGTAAIGNVDGIFVDLGTSEHIGGAGAGQGNLISGNSATGIRLQGATGVQIFGNLIGTRADGKTALANGVGITDAQTNMTNNVIGGIGAGEANVIAFNNNQGVAVGTLTSGRGDSIRGNSIFSNALLGIDLGTSGVTPNDPGDADTGANELQNFPDLATADIIGGHAHVTGTVTGSLDGSFYQVDFYRSASCDPSAHGEGAGYIGTISVQPGTFDSGSFLTGSVAPGDFITATATDTLGDTSEFSACIQIPGGTPTFTVTTTADHADGACDAADCSLREAITALNLSGAPGAIAFDFNGAPAPHVIGLSDSLPDIHEPVTIDGREGDVPAVVLDGSPGTGNGTSYGLDFEPGSDGSVVRGLVVQNMQCGGECPAAPGFLVNSSSNTFEDNYVGTAADGLSSAPNDIGFQVTGSNNEIGSAGHGNLITASETFQAPDGGYDVQILGGSGNVIAGNLIGTDVTGNATFAERAETEVQIQNATGTVVGGPTLADGNVIANTSDGVDIVGAGGHDGSVVRYNSIGVGKDGVTSFGVSDSWGILVDHADDVTISNNVVGNTDDGIAPTSSKNLAITNNFIGVGRDGVTSQKTFDYGIFWNGSGLDGPTGGLINGNVISKNVLGGVALSGVDGVTFLANEITNNGTNSGGAGIEINGSGNTIEANTVTGNGATAQDPGVAIVSGTGNQIAENSIDGNGGLGIDLGDDGTTPNGQLGHAGPNLYQNFPGIDGATLNTNNSLSIDYHLASADSTYTVEFFSSPSCDVSGNGEGAEFLGSDHVTTSGGAGSGSVTIDNAATHALSVGATITATATDDTTENTSEFSGCFAATAGTSGGALVGSGPDQTPDTAADLTAAGTTDWVGWGSNGSISLTPTDRKVGGTGISDLSQQPGDGPPRNFGQFAPPAVPFAFNWSDGTPTATATGDPGASLGITAPQVGQGYSFTVPADTTSRTLTVWTSAHLATGHFTAALSDGSAPDYTYDLVSSGQEVDPGGQNIPAVFKLTYAAASAGQHLTVTWTESSIIGQFDDVVIYAAALSGDNQATSASATISTDPSVQISGSNDSIASIPLRAFNPDIDPSNPTVNGLPLNGLPLNGLPLNGLPLNGLPLNGLPLNGLPLNGLPLNGLPLNGLPLNGLPLNGLPLNGLPLNGLSWSTLLAGSPLADQPLQTVTLADVLALRDPPPALEHLTLGQLDLSGSIVGQETLGALALANLPLNGLGLPTDAVQTLVDWCQSVAPAGTDCTLSGKLGHYSLFGLGISGAPLNGLPLNGLPLNGLPLNGLATTVPPIQASPLNGLPLNGLELSASPLNGLPLNGLPLNGLLVGCTAGGTDCTTLGEAVAKGHLPNATIGDLFTFLTGPLSPVKDTVTLGDLMSILVKRSDVPWETLSPRLLSVFDTGRHEATVTAGVTLSGPAGGQAPAEISVKLPSGFDYVRGTSTGAATGDPQIDTGTNTLTWPVQATFGVAASVSFKVWSGTDVGPAELTADVSSGSTSGTAATTIDVTDSFTGNDAATTAEPVTPDQNVQLSSLPTAGSVDYYKIPLPEAGTRLEVHLTNLHADFDLALYANQSTTVRTGATAGVPLQDDTVSDTAVNLQGATNPQLTPTALQDIPDPGIPVVQVSANRGTDDEDVGMVSPGTGSAYVAVFGYNGASSPLPYSLRVKTIPPPQDLTCPARTLPHPGQGTAGALPTTFAANVNTLFLVNEKRYGDTYGSSAESNLVAKLADVAGRNDLGVSGAVIPVEAVAGSQYQAWDQRPCSPEAANAVANAIANEVASLKVAHPTIKYVVFVGGDDQVPFFRIPDLSRIANENGFASEFSPNEYWGALANSDLLTDDPYLDTRPIPASGRQLFIPDLIGGRLTEESGQDALDAIQRFEDSSGTLAAGTAFVSGYDFVTDGSEQVSAALARNGLSNAPLLGDWSKADLLGATQFTNGINDWNGHFDNTRALTANGEIFGTSDLKDLPDRFSGGIFFTMGCHAGFQTTDAIVGSPTLDWAEYFAGTGTGFVGNTGYGLGNTDSVAFSEELMTDFATNLDGTKSIGDALADAKSQYYLSRVAFSPYDEKTLSEAEFYGMPMYGVGTAPHALAAVHADTRLSAVHADAPASTVPGTTGTLVTPDASTLAGFPGASVQGAPFDVTPTFSAVQHGDNGDFLTNDGQVQAPNYRPLQPYVSLPATRTGLTAHGVVIDGLTSSDISPFDPDNVRPTLDLSANEPEPQFGDEAWPEKVPTLVSLDGANGLQQSLNLATGQFFTQASGSGTSGVERKWTHITGRVTYSTSQDFTPPTIDSMNAFMVDPGPNQRVSFTGHFTDLAQNGNPGTVQFAQVVYDLEDGTGAWGVVPLVLDPGSGAWTGGAPFTDAHIQYFVVVCDAAGNCGYSSNKGRYFDALALPSPQGAITVTPVGSPHGAFYTGSVTIETTAPQGVAVQVSVDGGPLVDPSSVHITGDGAHTIDARGSDGSTASTSVILDNTAPTVLFFLPTDVRVGDTVPVSYTCADSGSGIATCSGDVPSGSALDTTNAGDRVIHVTATDAVGRQTALSQTVHVRSGPSTPGKPAAIPAPNKGTFSVSWTGSSDDVGHVVKYDLQRAASAAGPWTTVAANLTATSAPQTGLAQGTYSYRVLVGDGTLSAISPVSDPVIVDTTPPTVQITSGCPVAKVDPGTTVTLHYSAADTGGSGLVEAATGTVSKLVSTPGPASLDVVVHDHSGNTGTATCQFRVNGAPTTPGKPSASASPNLGTFTLTWAPSTDPDGDAITYTLQHKLSTSSTFTNVATGLTTASYAFTSASPEAGGTWVYQVIAKDATLSSAASPPSNPVIVKATPTISWTPAALLFGAPLGAAQLNATATFNNATVGGAFVYVPPSGTVVQPGQMLSVTFTPSDTTHFLTATKTVPVNVTFSQACLTSSLSGSVTVKNNQAYCIQAGGKVTGSITVQSGGSLYVNGGSVSGSVTATGAKALTMCNASVSGSLTATSATGPVMIGAATGCTKNTISGSVTLTSNAKGVTLFGNAISGSVTAASNAGGTVISGDTVSQSVTVNANTGGITVTNDKIGKSLTVTNNKGGYTINGNVVGGSTTIVGNS